MLLIHLGPRRRARLGSLVVFVALATVGISAQLIGRAAAATTGYVDVSDTTPGFSPTVTFTYTLTRNRHEASGANFFYMFKPASFPNLTPKTCTELKALTTVKVNNVVQDNDTFIDTGVCAVWTGGVQLRLKNGIQLNTGDVVNVILAADVLTNPASISTTTWTWRTSDASGGNSDDFTASLVTGGSTTAPSSTVPASTVPATTVPASTVPATTVAASDNTGTTVPAQSSNAPDGGGDRSPGGDSPSIDFVGLTNSGMDHSVTLAVALSLLLGGFVTRLALRRHP